MEQISKNIKVVWLCHFSNEKIRKRLPLSKRRIYNFIRSLFGMRRKEYHDFAPWVNNLIIEFEKIKGVELHIIAPHKGLKVWKYEFGLNGINYHFFKPDLLFPWNKIEDKINKRQKREFPRNRLFITGFLRRIKPDIVNLIGTENPYYSIAALDIDDVPVYISVQTVYTNPLRKKYSDSCVDLNWNVELELHKKFKYYGCEGRLHHDLILNNNSEAIFFKMFFPIQKPSKVKDIPKEYDFVFFAAGVTKKKGIEDAIEALALVKTEKNNVTLNVVGKCTSEYKEHLLFKIKKLNLDKNISFNDYFPVHSDMYQHIKKARFAILPIKLDVISTTVIEAMLLEIPLVTYKTTGTPYLNKDGETVLLADINDIEGLSVNMLKLLNSPELVNNLKKNARAFIEKEFDNKTSALRLVDQYKAVINNYYNNTPIPKKLLLDIKEFPIY